MAILYNRARMSTATTGTGTITLVAASTGYASFAEAGVQNGDTVSYCIEDGNNFEVGRGVYASAGLTLTRPGPLLSKIAGEAASSSPLSLSGSATVFLTALAEDLITRTAALTDNRILRGDGGAAGAQTSVLTISDEGYLTGVVRFGVGGATPDATNVFSINAPALLLNRATDDIQVKLNKEAAGDTASFLFQTNFNGFAEIGLTGDDDFHFKVSPDNFSTTYEGLIIDKDSGQVTLPQRILTIAGLAAGSAQIVLGEDTDNGSNTATLKAPEAIGSSFTLTLPEADDTLATITDVLDAGPNLQTGTSYTLQLTDDGQIVSMNNASANEVTIPANVFSVGATVNIVMRGAGTTTITADTGVTLNGVSTGSGDIQNQFQGVSLYQESSNSWIASGDIGTVA